MAGPESTEFPHDDAPYLKIGQGPPLLLVPGLTPEHDVPKGWQRRPALASARPFARDFTVCVINRKRGLRPGESMSDIAHPRLPARGHTLITRSSDRRHGGDRRGVACGC